MQVLIHCVYPIFYETLSSKNHGAVIVSFTSTTCAFTKATHTGEHYLLYPLRYGRVLTQSYSHNLVFIPGSSSCRNETARAENQRRFFGSHLQNSVKF